jgi:hypothetical protein
MGAAFSIEPVPDHHYRLIVASPFVHSLYVIAAGASAFNTKIG